jgi:hypothetical protein
MTAFCPEREFKRGLIARSSGGRQMGIRVDPNVKKITWVARECMAFGRVFPVVALLFLLMFIFILAATPADWARPDNAAIVGSVLVLLGAIFVCLRIGVILDRQRRTITTWWGLLVPFHKIEHSFSQAHFVTISHEKRGARGRGSPEIFPVRLEGAGTDAITIHEPLDHDKARHLAEDVAKFVHLGIRDRSSGEEVVREAGALDQSLQQRLRRAGSSMPLPAQPPHPRAIVNYGGTRAPTTIEIPPVGRIGRGLLLMICMAGIVALSVEWGMNKKDIEIGVRSLLVFLLVLGFSLPLLLHSATLREHLAVSPDELVVTRRDIFRTKTTRLTSREIEEVQVIQAKDSNAAVNAAFGGGPCYVVIRSDRGSIKVGAELSNPEEVKWLSGVLVHVLTSVSRDA